jgi:hypothetical protein
MVVGRSEIHKACNPGFKLPGHRHGASNLDTSHANTSPGLALNFTENDRMVIDVTLRQFRLWHAACGFF